jgi:hypothetical protein
MAQRGRVRKVTCEECFFFQRGLCAVTDRQPCATFRPAGPDGLRPPRQLRFAFRQERSTRAAWAFPSAQEQAALHA